jgi:hypothetical protein
MTVTLITEKWSLRKTAARQSVEILTILILQVHFP